MYINSLHTGGSMAKNNGFLRGHTETIWRTYEKKQ